MKRARLLSAPRRTSSCEVTMFSGGDDAIIRGKLPMGQTAERSARLMTLPARSLAFSASLSFTISGVSEGGGTLSYHSVKLPEPGSCTSHMPDRSGGAAGPVCPCAEAHKAHSPAARRAKRQGFDGMLLPDYPKKQLRPARPRARAGY